jgi:hypothetical protein
VDYSRPFLGEYPSSVFGRSGSDALINVSELSNVYVRAGAAITLEPEERRREISEAV